MVSFDCIDLSGIFSVTVVAANKLNIWCQRGSQKGKTGHSLMLFDDGQLFYGFGNRGSSMLRPMWFQGCWCSFRPLCSLETQLEQSLNWGKMDQRDGWFKENTEP